MSFNPDLTKMVQEVFFSRKKSKVIHPSLIFNEKDVNRSESQKHLSLVLDSKLNSKRIPPYFRMSRWWHYFFTYLFLIFLPKKLS